jgi:hypothetical protein
MLCTAFRSALPIKFTSPLARITIQASLLGSWPNAAKSSSLLVHSIEQRIANDANYSHAPEKVRPTVDGDAMANRVLVGKELSYQCFD